MSLDVYLTLAGSRRETGSGIFVREDGSAKEITREEWDARFPGREPVVCSPEPDSNTVFDQNITHNLGKMAGQAGLYEPLWRPDECGIAKACDLLIPLTDGLAALRADPERFKAFNPSNGWGDYDGLVRFTENYLEACKKYPDADVHVSR